MPTLQNINTHIKQYGLNNKQLYALGFMLLFWGIFDGIIFYITPLIIIQNNISKTEMGLIIGFSYIAGAIFDILLCRFLNKRHYRKIFIFMFIICLIYPLILGLAQHLIIFLIAMALWGLYHDLRNYGRFDFVARRTKGPEHASSFGVINSLTSLGYLLAPLFAGLIIVQFVDWQPLILAWIFLAFSFFFFFVLKGLTKRDKSDQLEVKELHKINFISEIKLWAVIAKIIAPVLALTILMNVVDAFFWTIGPIMAQSIREIGNFNGLILMIYQLPLIFVGWFVGPVSRRFGKKRTAYISFLLGSLILSLIALSTNGFVIVAIIFLSSSALAMAWPSINGAYADYLAETPKYSPEIEGVENFSTNLGFIIGPILAGFGADMLGERQTFGLLGLVCAMVAFILLKYSKQKINVNREILAIQNG